MAKAVIGLKNKLVKRTVRSFLLWHLCFVLIAGTIVTTSQILSVQAEKQAYEAQLSADARRLADSFGADFRGFVDSCNSIFLSRWYKHYRNNAGIYASEFDPLRRMEILDELRFRLTPMAYVSDILVVTPPPLGTIITPNGWFSFSDYEKIYGAVQIDYQGDYTQLPTVTAQSGDICVITLSDANPRQLQGVICIVVSKKAFAGMFESMLPAHVLQAQAVLEGQTLYGEPLLGEKHLANSAAVSMPPFSLTLYSQRYEDALLPGRLVQYAMMMVIAFFACAVLAALVVWLSLKPLHSLLEKYGVQSKPLDDPYQFIDGYIEAYSEANARLRWEKESAEQSISQFLSQMRNEILFGIITNPDIDCNADQIRMCLPWIDADMPFLLVLIKRPPFEATAPIQASHFAALTQQAQNACAFPVFFSDLCLLLWYPDDKEALQQWQKMDEMLPALAQGQYRYAYSAPLHSLSQVREEYMALEAGLPSPPDERLTLPLATQIQLINLLHQEKMDECNAWLLELEAQGEIGQEPLLQFLLRVAAEYNVDTASFAGDYQAQGSQGNSHGQWLILLNLAQALFAANHVLRHEGINQTAEAIRRFVDEHYTDPSLSMQTLSDHFNMHRTLISRLLKAHLGITFSEYLQSLRINQAIAMMRSTEQSIVAIAGEVGYVNYLTFKRAFVRHCGITPSEYRTQ